jgi:hypothetical protein
VFNCPRHQRPNHYSHSKPQKANVLRAKVFPHSDGCYQDEQCGN